MSKILVVDDDVDLAELIKTKLTAEGHDVQAVNSGEGAFELAKEAKPTVAILDIMLPGVTGYQICRKFRKDPELYGVAILILTALGEEPEVMHGLEQGADDYLAKPFKLDALMEKVAAMEALVEAVQRKNPVTGMVGTEGIKREINYRLARGTAIAACYISIIGFKPYVAARGKDGQRIPLEFTAKMLTTLMRNMGIYESFIAHLGGEHFVVLLNIDDHERFTSSLMSTFDHNVRTLYSEKEVQQGHILATDKNGQQQKCPLMALSVGVAHTQYRTFKTAKKMFEILAQTRQMAQPIGGSAIFVDRRRSDR